MAGRVAGIWRDLHRLSCSILRSGERRRGCSFTQASGGMRSTKLSSLAIFLLLLHSAQASDGKATSHLAYWRLIILYFSRQSLKFSSSLNELKNDFVEKNSLELAHLMTDGKCTKSLIMIYLHPKTHQIELLQHQIIIVFKIWLNVCRSQLFQLFVFILPFFFFCTRCVNIFK